MNLWMKVRDLLNLALNEDLRRGELDNLDLMKASIQNKGWIEGCTIMICDGKIAAGFRRLRAIRELVTEGKLTSEFMVQVEVRRTMMVPMLLDVTKPAPIM